LLQTVTKTQDTKQIHFICIDQRVKEPTTGKVFIVLQNGQKIIMPDNVSRVPALLLLNDNYKVIYGDDIYRHLKPRLEVEIQQATQRNMEPVHFQDGFSFGSGGSGGIVSDSFSFLDQPLNVDGNGGMRQMHNYMSLQDSMTTTMTLPEETERLKEGQTSVEAIQRKRNEELSQLLR
jgi:hypothetical protein